MKRSKKITKLNELGYKAGLLTHKMDDEADDLCGANLHTMHCHWFAFRVVHPVELPFTLGSVVLLASVSKGYKMFIVEWDFIKKVSNPVFKPFKNKGIRFKRF